MSIEIALLTQDREGYYEELLHSCPSSLLYSSIKYRNFLQQILVNSQDYYLLAYDSGCLVGALPSFIKRNSTYGNILNSLPFYGSNGGVIISPQAAHPEKVKQALIDAFQTLAIQESVVVSTLISNPLASDVDFYESYSLYTLRDERIGQLVNLPKDISNHEKIADSLMNLFHQKTRNCVRKAQKSEITIYHSDSLAALQALVDLHQENISAIGGMPKPFSIFTAIRDTFVYDQDYRIYLAEKDGQIIAGLLVFFYNHTAEYYTPATLTSYRIYQPMSLIIYEAMLEAIKRGYLYWNWGGTWLTQTGVYNFKSRWGTQDKKYFYYIKEYDNSDYLRQLTSKQILAEYPHFYVLPFHLLKK
ncbi:GNAT family N-acetyltransferase [Nostoc sp. LEGE 06077]|uniref:GNAT family N-acetyltransferase n=1 Tax=Nostoc sp. LEGE 06077 TaxID=915325 RepID=UPI001880A5D8|nr:GNAT family N-acetyltransferase [Nostoc sp. LEGE 06077]MBE9207148.1 GNAT family N-acetyltransferase [Nostoc sp. LEGE 06077]